MNKSTKQNHVFTGVFIPAKIWIHKGLIPQEKMMLGEIKTLSEETGWCFANNKHFADWLGCGIPNVSNYIQKFQKEKMIEVKYSDQKTHAGRKMRVNMEWYHGLPTPYTGNEAPYTGNEAPYTGAVTEIQSKYTSKLNERGEAPAPNPSNLQRQKKENGLVAPQPSENTETLEAEKTPSKKVAPKKDSPGDCKDCDGNGYADGCTDNCSPCDKCDGTGKEQTAQFEVTAIASPTDLPCVTIVEAALPFTDQEIKEAVKENQEVWAKIAPRRNGRIEIPDEAAAEILPWANGDGEQTVKKWYEQAYRQHSPKDVETMVLRFSTVFLSSPTASTRDMMETNPLSFFKRRFSKFVADQPSFDRMNAPKEGSPTRNQTPPANFQTSTRY